MGSFNKREASVLETRGALQCGQQILDKASERLVYEWLTATHYLKSWLHNLNREHNSKVCHVRVVGSIQGLVKRKQALNRSDERNVTNGKPRLGRKWKKPQ